MVVFRRLAVPNTRQASPATLFPKEGSWLSLWESTKGTSFASLSPQVTERVSLAAKQTGGYGQADAVHLIHR